MVSGSITSGSIVGSGLDGINKGFGIVGGVAEKISDLNQSEDQGADIASSLVDLQRGKLQVQASAKVLEAEGEMIGSLINLKV